MAREVFPEADADVFAAPALPLPGSSLKRKASALDTGLPPSSAFKAPRIAPQHRLLWRGTLIVDGVELPGLAFVVHLPPVTTATEARPNLLRSLSSSSATQLATDDPFSPFAPSSATYDICLDIEMTRHRPLHVTRTLPTRAAPPPPDPVPPAKGKARKGKPTVVPRRPPPEMVTIEREADVRVYVDARCGGSIEWLEKRFCAEEVHEEEGRTSHGLIIPLGDDEKATELFLFGELLPTENARDDPRLQLYIGTRRVTRVAVPRPDDPMPRDSIFVQQLKRSASQPVLHPAVVTAAAQQAAAPRPRNPFARAPSLPAVRHNIVPGSPTPSSSSSAPGKKRASQLVPTKQKATVATVEKGEVEAKGKMARSMSLPANAFAAKLAAASTDSIEKGAEAIEAANKAAIRKVVVACLKERGVGRESEEFKDLFGQVCKGVQFAMRSTMARAPVDKGEAKRFAIGHLDMYRPHIAASNGRP